MNGQEIELKEGEFLNIQKGEKHTWRNDTNLDCELIVIFSPAGIENMFIELAHDASRIAEIGIKYGTYFDV